MTALDSRPTTPAVARGVRLNARMAELLGVPAENVGPCSLPTCLDAHCYCDVEAQYWVHTGECVRRRVDPDEWEKWVRIDKADRERRDRKRVSGRDARAIEWAEDTLRGAHDEVWRERSEAQARVRRAAGDAT